LSIADKLLIVKSYEYSKIAESLFFGMFEPMSNCPALNLFKSDGVKSLSFVLTLKKVRSLSSFVS
jgi:hypothetical protein